MQRTPEGHGAVDWGAGGGEEEQRAKNVKGQELQGTTAGGLHLQDHPG